MGLLPDYANQARTYDRTRTASPSVLLPLRQALAGAPGAVLADVGGGTGNYAAALAADGWRPVVVDRSAAMLEHAAQKGLETAQGDAQRLPLASGTFDAAMLIAMLHHVDDRAAALTEARRILRPGGRLAVMAFTREDVRDLWILDYFPSSRPWMDETHPPLADIMRHLPGAIRLEVRFDDLQDACMAALASHPDLILDRSWRRHTSYFERLERDDPEALENGLDRLRADHNEGRAPSTRGRASMIAWTAS